MRNLPPSKIVGATLDHAVFGDGCVVNAGSRIERSIIGIRSRIGTNVQMKEVVMIGADKYETDHDRLLDSGKGVPPIGVGDDCIIERAILDKDCHIGKGVRIRNRAGIVDAEGDNYVIRDGIVVIPRSAVVPDGTEI